MKKFKYLLVFALALTVMSLAACAFLPSSTPKPNPKPDNGPKPITRGETVVIFGATSAFTVVYDGEDTDTGVAFADRVATEVSSLGLKKPEISVDTFKTETKCELLIGNTSRALSAEAKAIVEENLTADENGEHWVFLYRDGQLAIYANKASAYERALADLTDKYYKAGEITVKKSTEDVGYVEGPHDAYMEYQTPGNFYDGYADPFADMVTEYKRMTLTRKSEGLYNISYLDERGGVYTVSFVRKEWGVWMFGPIVYTERNGTRHVINSAYTDNELVIRIGGKTEPTTRGGNHGNYPKDTTWQYYVDDTSYYNDKLLDLTFYDARSGEKIVLDTVGSSVQADGIRIVEHHNTYEMNYTQENVLANVERSYLFNGYDILFDATHYMTQDVRMRRSNSCMLSITKQYGNCCMFYLEDGSTVFMKTPMSNTVDETRMGVNATHIDLWGENNPRFHMTVDLFDPDQLRDSDPEDGYCGFREMLAGATNKLYCTLFTAGGSLKHGEELHFKNKWSFSIQDDFVNPDREPDYWVGLPK